MEIRVELFPYRRDRFYIQRFQGRQQLFVDLVHSDHERILGIFLCRLQAAFKIIHNRKDFFDHALCADLEHSCLLPFGTLPEIIEFRHLALNTILQLSDLFIFFILFLLPEKSHIVRLLTCRVFLFFRAVLLCLRSLRCFIILISFCFRILIRFHIHCLIFRLLCGLFPRHLLCGQIFHGFLISDVFHVSLPPFSFSL